MSCIEIFALAVAVSIDAFAVALCVTCRLPAVTPGHYARLGLTFGFFQAAMPIISWYCGLGIRPLIDRWDHWIAFFLLAWIAGSMIYDSFRDPSCPTAENDAESQSRGLSLLMLAVATSIDSLAIGFSFSLLRISIWIPALIIGSVCTVITMSGIFAGRLLGNPATLCKRSNLVGGCVLFAIGVKILIEHGVFD